MSLREDYNKLLEKYLSGKCSEEELKFLSSLKEDFDLKEIEWDESQMGDRELVKTEIQKRIAIAVKPPRKMAVKYLSAAAVFIVFFVGAYFIYRNSGETADSVSVNKKISEVNDFAPAANVALLTINGNESFSLNGAVSPKEIVFNGNKIGIINGGQILLYKANNSGVYKISTPKAGKFKIILPDKTHIWLNSQSGISFNASAFNENRRVELSGEAYFEVTKNKEHPFFVKVNSSEIKVLGTHFNVKANAVNKFVQATLFEGSIAIKNGKTTKILKPGQEAVAIQSPTRAKEEIIVNEVDLDKKAGWKKGYFIFDKVNIRQVMQELSDWYNVEVEYRGEIKDDLFKGKIRNDLKLTEVLGILELNGVHFEILDNKVLVKP